MERKKKFELSNKQALLIGIGVFVIAAAVFWLIFSAQTPEDPNMRRIEELNVSKGFERNTPEWLALRTGQLGEMLVNGEIGAEAMVDELVSLSSDAAREKMAARKTEYLQSISDYLKLMRASDEKVLKTRYGKPEYLNENECYIERAQYFNNMKLFYRQRFIKENGQWKILSDGAVNDFNFR